MFELIGVNGRHHFVDIKSICCISDAAEHGPQSGIVDVSLSSGKLLTVEYNQVAEAFKVAGVVFHMMRRG